MDFSDDWKVPPNVRPRREQPVAPACATTPSRGDPFRELDSPLDGAKGGQSASWRPGRPPERLITADGKAAAWALNQAQLRFVGWRLSGLAIPGG